MRGEEMLAEIEDFIEGFNQPMYRAMRIDAGPGVAAADGHGPPTLSCDRRGDRDYGKGVTAALPGCSGPAEMGGYNCPTC